jgi:hypothetical protein
MRYKPVDSEPIGEVIEVEWENLDHAMNLSPWEITSEIMNKLEKEYPYEWKIYCECWFSEP